MSYTDQQKRLKKIADRVKENIEILISIDSSYEQYRGALFISMFSYYLEKGIDV